MKPTKRMMEAAIEINRDPNLGLEDLLEKILDMALGSYDGPERVETVELCKSVQAVAQGAPLSEEDRQSLTDAAVLLALRSGMAVGLQAKVSKYEAMLETMTKINEHQARRDVHPLTCGVDSSHRPLIAIYKPGMSGVTLECPDCRHHQEHIPEMFR